MPLRLPDKLPAIELLKAENIFVMDSPRTGAPPLCHLRIAILNLMPLKITTETDLIRLLSNTPLHLDVELMKLSTHKSKNTPEEHIRTFYRDFSLMRDERYDGLIITGAPVEHIEFEEVDYWRELTEVFEWSRTHVASTMFICWAAQAALYHHYGIRKYPLGEKMFGIFSQKPLHPELPLLRGFDDIFYMPHSRHTELRREDILQVPSLTLVAEGEKSGVSIVMARGGRDIYVTGHSEYAPDTLDAEYKRDLAKGLPIHKPENYYADDDPKKGVQVSWRTHGNMLFLNWLNYYVYQKFPLRPQ